MQKTTPNKVLYGWFMWSLGTLFYVYQFVLRASPNVMAQDLMQDFSINAATLGLLSSSYYYAYAFLQIPLGWLLDRIGTRQVVRFSVIICVTGTLVMSIAPNLFIATLGRICIGAGASGAFLSTIAISRQWLPPAQVALAVGITIACGKLGGVLSNGPLALLIHSYDWRTALTILFIIGVILSLGIWLFLANKKVENPEKTEDTEKGLRILLHSWPIWIIGLYGCFMYVPLTVFADIWGTLFVMKKYMVSRPIAAWAVGLVFVGTALGSPLIAFISEKIKSRKIPMLVSAITSFAVCWTIIFHSNADYTTAITLMLLCGFLMTGQTLVFTCAAEIMPARISGLATGFVNTINMVGGALLQPFVGFLLDSTWEGQMIDGVRFYTLSNYQWALGVLPFSTLLSAALILLMRETYKKHAPVLGES